MRRPRLGSRNIHMLSFDALGLGIDSASCLSRLSVRNPDSGLLALSQIDSRLTCERTPVKLLGNFAGITPRLESGVFSDQYNLIWVRNRTFWTTEPEKLPKES